ncbi:hypothetical protein DTL42_25485 [Bremerella cremea]|uniref:Uncharacterized protein n=1 Tax=Bremerella cremea TaxID=1031537 RepID=A0A368KLS2_9BACT|nr:hypothetical protein [Bremerella cremea]RCS40718.1 hypothetical protein DTL42_25485 [Bremerella cremea]
MTSRPEITLPFQSPQADDYESIRVLIGETNFEIGQRLRSVYLALIWQAISINLVGIITFDAFA